MSKGDGFRKNMRVLAEIGVVKQEFLEEMRFEQRLKEVKGASHLKIPRYSRQKEHRAKSLRWEYEQGGWCGWNGARKRSHKR